MNAPVTKLRPAAPEGSPPDSYDPNGMPPAIGEAVNAIMSTVKNVEKNGENSFHRYSFAKVEDLLFQVQPAMAENGLIIIQSEIGTDIIADALIKATYDFRLAHKTGVVWTPEEPIHHSGMASIRNTKGGYDDKSLSKCHTAARKYFLMGLFQIPAGDLPDADGDEGNKTPSLEERATALLRTAAVDRAMFKDVWEKNKGGWKSSLDSDAYARVVGVMQDLVRTLPPEPAADAQAQAPAPPPPPPGAISRAAMQPLKVEQPLLDDEIPF